MHSNKFNCLFYLILFAYCLSMFTSCETPPTRKRVESPVFNQPSKPLNKKAKEENIEEVLTVKEQELIADLIPREPLPLDQNSTDSLSAKIVKNDELTHQQLEYLGLGYEKPSFIARMLLGGPQKTKDILSLNPNLSLHSKIKKNEIIKVPIKSLNIEPTLLTDYLVTKYAKIIREQLISKYKNQHLDSQTTLVKKGESLQDISLRLYGTTRYWTELYLLNADTLNDNFNIITAGQILVYYDHSQ